MKYCLTELVTSKVYRAASRAPLVTLWVCTAYNHRLTVLVLALIGCFNCTMVTLCLMVDNLETLVGCEELGGQTRSSAASCFHQGIALNLQPELNFEKQLC